MLGCWFFFGGGSVSQTNSSQSISQSASQSASQPVNQLSASLRARSISQSVSQSASQSVSQLPAYLPACVLAQSVNQSICSLPACLPACVRLTHRKVAPRDALGPKRGQKALPIVAHHLAARVGEGGLEEAEDLGWCMWMGVGCC